MELSVAISEEAEDLATSVTGRATWEELEKVEAAGGPLCELWMMSGALWGTRLTSVAFWGPRA